MRIETNERIIKRNRQIAQSTFFISMAIWLASLVVTFMPLFGDATPTQLGWMELVSTLVLPFALGLALFAVHMTNLWIREPRPEQAIRTGLKGVSSKSIIYHYHHTPAKHVLITPQGIFVFIVRWQRGHIVVDEQNKWRFDRSLLARIPAIFRLERLGNPNAEAERAASYLHQLIDPIAPDVTIQPIIVITDPRTELTIHANEVPYPVLYADEKQKPNLKSFFRKHPNKGLADLPLSDEQLAVFEEKTLPNDDK